MTYKLITEDELKQAIDALESFPHKFTQSAYHDALSYPEEGTLFALATLRAVMERRGPKPVGLSAITGAMLYTLPEEPTT